MKVKPLRHEDFDHLMSNLYNLSKRHYVRDWLILTFIYKLGLQPIELCGLKISDVRNQEGVIGNEISITRKNGTIKKVQLNKNLQSFFKQHLLNHHLKSEPENRLFESQKFKMFTAKSLRDLVNLIIKKAGFTEYSCKSLRLGCEYNLHQKGKSVEYIADFTGRADRYKLRHLLEEIKKE